MNKRKLILYGAIIVFTIVMVNICSIFNAYTPIEDAVVNNENGDIAFAYYDNYKEGLQLVVYDYEGRKLWTKNLYSAGGTSIYLGYLNQNLVAYVSRTNTFYTFDRNGAILSKKNNVDRSSKPLSYIVSDDWKGWKRLSDGYQYDCENLAIKYVYSRSFIGKCCLYIESSSGSKMNLYESNE